MSTPSQGAIKAAEIITQGNHAFERMYRTDYGKKTVRGIADLIDNETHASELLAALESAVCQMEQCEKLFRDDASFMASLSDSRAAIAKAKGVTP